MFVRDDDGNNNSNNRTGFRCSNPNCKADLGPSQQPCPRCGNSAGIDIIQVVTEEVGIKERPPIAVLGTLKRDYPFLLGSIAVTIFAPVITPFFGLNEPIPTIIGVFAGLVAFLLGTKGLILVKRILGS